MWILYLIGGLIILVGLASLTGKYLNERHKAYRLLEDVEQAVGDGANRQNMMLSMQESAAIDHLLSGKTVKVIGTKKFKLITLKFENPAATYDRAYALDLIRSAKAEIGELTRIDLIERNYRA